MALTTYTELQAAIADRMHRTDLTSRIVDYITLAEKRLNRTLNQIEQETEATLTATVGSRTLTLPALFNTAIGLWLTTYLPRIELEFRLPADMPVYSSNGPASMWTIDGGALKVDTPADLAYTYTFRYLQSYALASTSTNSLITNHPDLYLFGALMEAADDVRDDAGFMKYKTRYDQALLDASVVANANRSLAKLRTEFSSGPRAIILRGG